MTPTRLLVILAILTISILQSCSVGTSRQWKDESIEQSLRNEIQDLDTRVIESIRTNDPSHVKTIMSDMLLKQSGSNISQLIGQVASAVDDSDYETLNQFHVKNSTTGIRNTVISGVSQRNDFVINYQALNKEMFISLLIQKNEPDVLIITNIYGKYPDGWKLNILQFGTYKVDGKTAVELYVKAKGEYEKGHLIDAANDMFLSSKIANPASTLWKYQKEEEMKEFYEKVINETKASYNFPLTLNEINSKPQIINIFPQGTSEGYFPMVEYLTSIDLNDTVRTKVENELIHQSIGHIFKGIDKDKRYLYYKAYNEMPNGTTPVPTYGFVKKLN
jgi:hypothetical protein